jgi:hypothetical protein
MLQRIRECLNALPFVPFTILTADGRSYEIKTRDHLAVGRGIVIVLRDDDSSVTLSGLLITGVEVAATAA